jgi:uncharacterized membrane protein YeaQ/YmgE (transglycosylase-associated protein family)
MDILLFLSLGLTTGCLAGRNAGDHGLDYLVTGGVGAIGALLGGWLFTLLGIRESWWNFFGSLAAAIGGAVVLLVVHRLLKRQRSRA